ncbi:alpha/beta hydrolase family protein [Holdemania filiformis]|uniref:alpha/beta hydrolase family protein n=1 Tax=Holdemania filiformis TaxID=61171 RepID=UPI00242CE466|nr:S9 family peptidase [Holdemania filiformis]
MNKITIDHFQRVQFLSALALSPAGQPAWVRTSIENDTYTGQLFVLDHDQPKQLTSGNESLFVWDDEKTLLFISSRGETPQPEAESTTFYRIRTDGGEAVKAFTLPLKVRQIIPVKKGLYVLTAQIDLAAADYWKMSEAEREAVHQGRRAEADYQIVSEQPYYQDGAGYTNGLRSRLFLYDEAQNELKPLCEPQFHVSRAVVSPDHNHLAISGAPFVKVRQPKEGLYRMDLDTLESHCLLEPGQFAISEIQWLSETQILAAMSDQKRYGAVENPFFYTLDAHTGKRKLLAENEESLGSALGSDCQYGSGKQMQMGPDGLFMVHTLGAFDEIRCLKADGTWRTIMQLDGSIQALAVADEKLWLIAMLGQKLPELVCFDLKTNELRAMTAFNEAVLADCYVAKPEPLSIPAGEFQVDGWVLKPKDYDPNQKYPAILNIHGGPKAAYGPVFFHEMQFWASAGYFVMFCNPRGSNGKGNAYAELRGMYGTIDYDDLMNFTDAVLAAYPAIDAERIGVTGGSYGGYMTNWMIGHTDRFAAAASQRSIANWVSLICYADIGFTFDNDQMGADPWSDVQKVWDQSPLQFADKAKTPTLFIHSFEDYRCLLQEGMQMYNALVHHGVEARMCLFKGESHGLSRIGKPSHRVRRLQEITAWMDRWCKPATENKS